MLRILGQLSMVGGSLSVAKRQKTENEGQRAAGSQYVGGWRQKDIMPFKFLPQTSSISFLSPIA